jgi:hypothetical protein
MGARFILPIVELGLDGDALCVRWAVMLRRIRGRGLIQFSVYPISSRDVSVNGTDGKSDIGERMLNFLSE